MPKFRRTALLAHHAARQKDWANTQVGSHARLAGSAITSSEAGKELFKTIPKSWFLLALCAAILVAVSPEVGHAASPLVVDDGSIDPWIIACAACVGFALGAGVFAIGAFLAFIASPAGQQLVYACAGACASAIMVE